MALETPNAICASMVIFADDTALPGQKQTLRSSNGIQSKVSEVASPLGTPGSVAVWQLEHPLSNDEAVIVGPGAFVPSGLLNAPNEMSMQAWIAPLVRQTSFVEFDSVLADQLVTLVASPNAGGQARLSLSIIQLITTVAPIVGEPLP